MIIYKTTNLLNGKIYIGQSIYDNLKYLGSGKLIKLAIRKSGKENFEKEILFRASSQNQLDIMEKYFIRKLNSRDYNIGYNITEGSTNPPNRKGQRLTQEHKDRIGLSISGEKNGNWGRIIQQSQKDAIAEANRKRMPKKVLFKTNHGICLFKSFEEASDKLGLSFYMLNKQRINVNKNLIKIVLI